jgi:hypothetical protein
LTFAATTDLFFTAAGFVALEATWLAGFGWV